MSGFSDINFKNSVENYVLMDKFKDWLNTHDLYNEHTTILAIPLDNPNITEKPNCQYNVCITAPAKNTPIENQPHPGLWETRMKKSL